MEYSNEAIELVESVLSSVNESKAYRKYSDQAQKKAQELTDRYVMAKAEGNQEKATKALKDLKKYNDSLAKYGTPYPVNNIFGGKSSEVYDKDMAEMMGAGYKAGDKEFKKNTGSARPKNIAVHKNINDRMNLARFDARNEAAMILIETLNTLLNE